MISEEMYYKVYYTTDIRKKVKKYSDGYMKVKGKYGEMTDEEGKMVGRTHNYKSEMNDDDEKVGYLNSYMILYDCEISKDDYISGRCYRPNYNPNGNANSTIQPSSSSHRNDAKNKKFKNPINVHSKIDEIDISKVHVLCDKNKNEKVKYTCYIEQFIKDELMPHQIEGVQFMFDRLTGLYDDSEYTGCILGDSMGLGKTLQIITLFWTLLRQNPFSPEPFFKKVVIITPVSLVKNWLNEVSTW